DASVTAAARSMDFARRKAAVRYILSHLEDRHVDAESIARGTGQSRSALYRQSEQYGGVAHYIMKRRLAAVRDALENGSSETLAVLAERHGFADESHMNRRFNRAYGQPAGAFRRAVSREGGQTLNAKVRRWEGWLSEIN